MSKGCFLLYSSTFIFPSLFIETFALTLRIVLPLLDLLLSKSIQKMTEALGNFPSCVMLSFTFFCCRETRGNVSVAFFRTVAWLPVDIARSRVIIRGEKRNVSICGRPENDWLLWLSKRYDEVGESDLEKRNVYIALHWAYILASFERRSNEMLYIEGGIGEISGLFIGYSPWTFPDRSHIQR